MLMAILATRHRFCWPTSNFGAVGVVLLFAAVSHAQEPAFESRTWTDKKGNQLSSTFVDAKNGEVQLKNDGGEVQKFKLADFSEPDQKYLRDLAAYRRKLAAGEKPQLPADPALASFDIQPRQTITEPVPEMGPSRKPLLDFPIRIWTDNTGKKVQGKLVTAYNDKIVLDVKGNTFDLPVTRLSPDDQAYVAVQLRGLQRDDLVNILAKAATAGQQQPEGAPAAPAPSTVATTTNPAEPAASSGTDDIRTRLEQLKAQLHGNAEQPPQVAANEAPAQPAANLDIQARLSQIREQKDASSPEPASPPAMPEPAEPVYSPPPEMAAAFEPPPSAPMFRMGKQCMSCRKEVPGHLTAGDKCPHCGVFFGKDMTTGKTAKDPWSAKSIGGLITLGIAVIAGIGKLIGKMSGNG